MAGNNSVPPPPPFTRLSHPDPVTNSIIQDLYDKLGAVAQSQASQNIVPAPTPAPSAPPQNIHRITKSYTLTGENHTVSANIQQTTSVLLPPSADVQGRGPFTIHNETGSNASLSLGSARGELVAGAAASSHILAPGESLTIQPHPGYWITTSQGSSAPGAGPSTTGGGGPPLPPGPPPPSVTTLPGPADPLSVVGNYIVLNGVQYVFTAPLTGGGPGFWAVSSATIITIRDTMANLSLYPAANYPLGTLFQATDWLVEYCVQLPTPTLVNTWLYYNGIYGALLASIPGALGVNDKNFQFRATDYLHNWLWNGSAWHLTTGGFPPGYTVFSASGPPFGGANALWHLEDGSTQNMSQDNGTTAATVLPNVPNLYIAL